MQLARRLLNLSVRYKLGCLLAILVINIFAVIFLGMFGMSMLSSLRAYVGGEGLWAKAQKDAVFSLTQYAFSQDEDDYQAYLTRLKVPLGDHQARVEMQKPDMDSLKAFEGFALGGNHPEDIPGMITLVRRFHRLVYIRQAVDIWTQADSLIEQLRSAGEELHSHLEGGRVSKERTHALLGSIRKINARLTTLENQFSYTLGAASRWAKRTLLLSMLLGSALVGILSLGIAFFISEMIASGIGAISQAAGKAAQGDLGVHVDLESEDELGRLARAFNQMVEALARKTSDLERSNAQLEQFAYAASHDLQEPLRKISGFAELLQKQYSGKLDERADLHIKRMVDGAMRMQGLISGLLEYSRAQKTGNPFEPVDLREVFEAAAGNLQSAIEESGARVYCENLPVVAGNHVQLIQLFQNLIANGIKFKRGNPPEVRVKAERRSQRDWLLSVQDNGIGIDNRYYDQLFIIFKRLHTRAEYPGNGIGLAICKGIVERHGGRIWVESQPGLGSTFCFTIPAGQPG